jgi:hypothetical protein
MHRFRPASPPPSAAADHAGGPQAACVWRCPWRVTPPGRVALMFVIAAASSGAALAGEVLDIGTRWELFVDRFLVAEMDGAALRLHEPVRREVALVTDAPWEGPTCAYATAIQDGVLGGGGRVLLFYRGSAGGRDHDAGQVTCVAESRDGIHFSRPIVGLIEASGTTNNNVVWRGVESHNFAPMLDTNPATTAAARFKALGGVKQPGRNWQQGETPGGLYAFVSADGLRWTKARPEPVITRGAFDSQNLAFFDTVRGRYAAFSRIFRDGVRAVQSHHSADFLSWSDGVPHRYAAGVPAEHFYTTATVPCPTAPHLFLAFPKRFVPDRKKIATHAERGVSDAVFMTSRDGVHWDRSFLEAWLRPGPDPLNWTDRNTMPATGIVETGPAEWSLYVSEHYRHPDHRFRRVTVRRQGFASMHASAAGGSFTTPPLLVTGRAIVVNYATSAAGSLRIEALDTGAIEAGTEVVADSGEIFGDELEARVLDVSALAGRPVRLRVTLRDADLYALRFAE